MPAINKIIRERLSLYVLFVFKLQYEKDQYLKCDEYSYPYHLTTFLNNHNLPLNGGYFKFGSNQVGVFITALR